MRDVITKIGFESKAKNVTMVKKDKFNTELNWSKAIENTRVRVSFNSNESKIEHFTASKKPII